MRFIAPILAYHSVHPQRRDVINVHPALFAKHMEWIAARGFRGVSLQTWADACATAPEEARRMIAITFDDGYLDNLTHAWPVLKRLGFGATVFAVPGRIGTDMVHDEAWLQQYPDVPAEAYRYMTWEQTAELQSHGVEIGAHTVTHPLLDSLTDAEQQTEIHDSKRLLEERLGTPVTSFCYPAGHFNNASLRLVESAGYAQAVVTPWTRGLIRGGRFTLKRSGLYRDDTMAKFIFKLTPFFDLFRAVRHAA